MLSELRIQDFAIIDELHLSFGAGFIVFTGETGAGKSIIIDAVEMLLGGRADTTMVRTGCDLALLEGTFKLSGPVAGPVQAILEREELLDDPKLLVLGREIRREGRNICRVNGRTVTLSLLSEIGAWLVDVHGQSEHLSLLRVNEHLGLLDRFAHSEGLQDEYRQVYRQLGAVRRELSQLRREERDAYRRTEMLTFQVQEIEAAALKVGEEEALREDRNRLANTEQLSTLSEQALAALDEAIEPREAATDLLGRAAAALASLARLDPSMEDVEAEAQALLENAADLASRLRLYAETIEYNPKRLDEVEDRLTLIKDLQRKYGEDIPAVLAYLEKASSELEAITHAEERMQALSDEQTLLLERLGEVGGRLSAARRQAGDQIQGLIELELSDLRMQGARFGVDLRWEDQEDGALLDGRRLAFDASGLDRAEFLVESNPGEGLKPLARVASGGETSRLMLAMKSVLAQADNTPTLIFDEIDQGIGGRVGAVVGRKLWGLTGSHQVLCITHLPQLAAYGDQHLKVEKQIKAGRTITVVRALEQSERFAELALMLGDVTAANLESATDLMRQAAEVKLPNYQA
jgi:DNA repair protein RecN (Recombination protein N)